MTKQQGDRMKCERCKTNEATREYKDMVLCFECMIELQGFGV